MINSIFSSSKCGYYVGVYGNRLICSRISEAGYAKYSFINDISEHHEGNIGHCLPKNWSFDQFHELKGKEKFCSKDGCFELDKTAFSGRDVGVVSPDYQSR
jgi:peptidoglycan hydrolase-like protein with peptidoglycan-binding domain